MRSGFGNLCVFQNNLNVLKTSHCAICGRNNNKRDMHKMCSAWDAPFDIPNIRKMRGIVNGFLGELEKNNLERW